MAKPHLPGFRSLLSPAGCVAWIALAALTSSCDVLGLGDDCTSDAAPVFTDMFTDLAQIESIVPLGTVSGGEIKDRHQVQILADTAPSGATSGRSVPVMAPARARLESVRHYRTTTPWADDYYGVNLQISCEVTARIDHIRTASEKLRRAAGGYSNGFEKPERGTTFEAGEIIGYTDGNPPAPPGEPRAFAFDFAVYNSRHENIFANMARYRSTGILGISLHSVCGSEYYGGTLRSAFLDALGYAGNSAGRDCRSASRDVAGTLAGGWFRVGTDIREDGGRLALAAEFDRSVRLSWGFSSSLYAWPVQMAGRVNLDPALANGTTPYCYTDSVTEAWLMLSPDGTRMSMAVQPGRCLGSPPTSYGVIWER